MFNFKKNTKLYGLTLALLLSSGAEPPENLDRWIKQVVDVGISASLLYYMTTTLSSKLDDINKGLKDLNRSVTLTEQELIRLQAKWFPRDKDSRERKDDN